MSEVTLTPQEERSWAAIAHLSVWLNLVIPLLAIVVPVVIFFVYRERSRYLAHQALQAILLHLVTQWLGGGLVALLALITALLSTVLVGLLCLPLVCVAALLPLAGYVYGTIGAVETFQGRPFRYYLLGDWADSLLKDTPTA